MANSFSSLSNILSNDGPLKGARDCIQKLRKIGSLEDGKVLAAAARAGMKPVLNTVRLLAPISKRAHKIYTGGTVEPGFSRKSFHVVVHADKANYKAIALLGPTKPAFYATQFVEVGTSRAPAHPFLRPALYANIDSAPKAMAVYLNGYLEKVAKGQS